MAFAAPRSALLDAPWAARLRVGRTGWRYALPLALLLAGALAFQLGDGPPASTAPRGDDAAAADRTAPLGLPARAPIDGGALVGALLVVGGLLAALPLVAKRVGAVTRGRGAITVVETRPLGGRRALLLVEVEGRKVLIGSAEAGLALLCQLDGAPTTATAATERSGFSSAFAAELAIAPRLATAEGA